MTTGDTFTDRDRATVRRFEEWIVTHLLGPWVGDLLDRAGPRPGERLLDIACGTGAVTRAAAARVGPNGSVCGLDISPNMLEQAAESAGSIRPAIEWRQGDTTRLPYDDARFDRVVCQQGLQFFADRVAAAREVRRVLVPGGRAAWSVWSDIDNNPYFLAVSGAVDRYLGPEAGGQYRSACALGSVERLREPLAAAGFRTVVIERVGRRLLLPAPEEFVPNNLEGTSLGPQVRAMDRDRLGRLADRVAEDLRDYRRGDRLEAPFEILIARTGEEANATPVDDSG